MLHPFLILFQRQTPKGPCTELDQLPLHLMFHWHRFSLLVLYMCVFVCLHFCHCKGCLWYYYYIDLHLIFHWRRCLLLALSLSLCVCVPSSICISIFKLIWPVSYSFITFLLGLSWFLSLRNIYHSVGFFFLVCFCFQFQLIYSNVVDMEYKAGKLCSWLKGSC